MKQEDQINVFEELALWKSDRRYVLTLLIV